MDRAEIQSHQQADMATSSLHAQGAAFRWDRPWSSPVVPFPVRHTVLAQGSAETAGTARTSKESENTGLSRGRDLQTETCGNCANLHESFIGRARSRRGSAGNAGNAQNRKSPEKWASPALRPFQPKTAGNAESHAGPPGVAELPPVRRALGSMEQWQRLQIGKGQDL